MRLPLLVFLAGGLHGETDDTHSPLREWRQVNWDIVRKALLPTPENRGSKPRCARISYRASVPKPLPDPELDRKKTVQSVRGRVGLQAQPMECWLILPL